MKNNFYDNKISAFFILLAITIFMLFCASKINVGVEKSNRYCIYSVEFNYYGMDSAKLEKLITQPLEEKLSELTDIIELRSSTEFGKSLISIFFDKRTDSENQYLAIRNIVDNFYNELPGDVQKPVIYNSDSQSKSVITIAVSQKVDAGINDEVTIINEIRSSVDAKLKKRLEGIEGVSQVVVSGGGQKEIQLLFDGEKSACSLVNPEIIALAVQDANSVAKSASIFGLKKNIQLDFSTRLKSLDEIASLPIKTGESFTEIKYVSDVQFASRRVDEIVRVNGKECVLISIKSNSDGNSINISRDVKNLLKEYSSLFDFEILNDEGENQRNLLKNVVIAFVQSFILVLCFVPLFFNSLEKFLLTVIFLLLDSIWSLGLLQIFGLNLTQHTIAGFSIALGLVSDPLLVVFECGKKRIRENALSLVTATCTTLVVLIPLLFLEELVAGVREIAITIAFMISVSIVLAIIFLPCFIEEILSDVPLLPKRFSLDFEKKYIRFSFLTARISIEKRKVVSVVYLFLVVLPFILFGISGKNLNHEEENDVIYASAEFENEMKGQYISDCVNQAIQSLQDFEGIKYVVTNSTKGSCEIEVAFNSRKISRTEVCKKLGELQTELKNCFLYIPSANAKKTKRHFETEIAFIGDDDKKCRELAKNASEILVKSGLCDSVVLNFKRPDTEFVFHPDKERLLKNGLTVNQVSSILRWFLFGPVADKWIQNGLECDIRISGKNMDESNLETIKSLNIPTKTGYVNLQSLGIIREEESNGKLFRKNANQAAYITAEIDGMSASHAMQEIKKELGKMNFEKGYGFSFPHELEVMKKNYAKLLFSFLFSVLLVFILIFALSEDLKKSLLLLSSIGASLVLPLLLNLVFGKGIQLGDVVAMVLLSGITINNSIYVMEGKSEKIEFKVREKIKSILVTSLTTIFGSFPLLIFAKDAFSKSLSFFMLNGVLNSLIFTLILFPGLLEFIKNKNLKL